MGLINLILNLAGLLLWLNWRAIRFDALLKTSPATLAGTLRRAEPSRLKPWHLLAGLGALLLLRTVLYWQIGSAVDWTPHFHPGGIDVAIPFRSDNWWRMLLFSGLSFLATLGVFYLWLLLLSLANGAAADSSGLQKLVRLHLGRVDRWPWQVRLLLPLLVSVAGWYLLSLLLASIGLIPSPVSKAHRFEQALVIGLDAYLSWRYLIGGILALHLVGTYVYLGDHLLWSFISLTGRNLLTPLRWAPLRLGKVDFAPLVGIALVFLVGELTERGLTTLYHHLPL
jgi:hypothetical protein